MSIVRCRLVIKAPKGIYLGIQGKSRAWLTLAPGTMTAVDDKRAFKQLIADGPAIAAAFNRELDILHNLIFPI